MKISEYLKTLAVRSIDRIEPITAWYANDPYLGIEHEDQAEIHRKIINPEVQLKYDTYRTPTKKTNTKKARLGFTGKYEEIRKPLLNCQAQQWWSLYSTG